MQTTEPTTREKWVGLLADHRLLVHECDLTRGEPRKLRAGHYLAGLVSELMELGETMMTSPRAVDEAGDVLWYVSALAALYHVSPDAIVARMALHPVTEVRLHPAVRRIAGHVQRHVRDGAEPDFAAVADALAPIVDHVRDYAGAPLVNILSGNAVKLRARLARGVIAGSGGAR